jgi:hypothetical protein
METRLRITEVGLTYPDFVIPKEPGKPELVAYAVFKLTDGCGFELWVNSCKLLYTREGGYFVQLPAEPRTIACRACKGRNADHASYCNWCGDNLHPQFVRGKFYDVVCPASISTRDAIVSALVAEHERRRREG